METGDLDKSFDTLRQLKDEIKLQLNLGKMEVKKAWENAEADFEKVETKLEHLKDRSGDEARRLRGELKERMAEVRQRFDELRAKS